MAALRRICIRLDGRIRERLARIMWKSCNQDGSRVHQSTRSLSFVYLLRLRSLRSEPLLLARGVLSKRVGKVWFLQDISNPCYGNVTRRCLAQMVRIWRDIYCTRFLPLPFPAIYALVQTILWPELLSSGLGLFALPDIQNGAAVGGDAIAEVCIRKPSGAVKSSANMTRFATNQKRL